MSLRARLIAGLLALAALGLVLLAGVTYAEQRHFLMSRVDDQVKQAVQWKQRPGPGGGAGGLGGAYGQPGDGGGLVAGNDGGGDNPPARGAGPLGPAAGTWSIARDPAGSDTPSCFSCYSTANAPQLPAGLTATQPT